MNIGIIGGADGPTTIFISSSVDWKLLAGAAALILGGLVAYRILKKRKN